MDLKTFIEIKQKELDAFRKEWETQTLLQPDNYPSDLAVGDWEEQYASYLASQNNSTW